MVCLNIYPANREYSYLYNFKVHLFVLNKAVYINLNQVAVFNVYNINHIISF